MLYVRKRKRMKSINLDDIKAYVGKNIGEFHNSRLESLKKLKAIGEKMRSCKIFDLFNPLIVPGSLCVTFNVRLRKW